MSQEAPKDLTACYVAAGPSAVVIVSYPLEDPPLDALSEAEREVVLHAYQGLTNMEIATLRKRSARTIANQLANAFRKLGVQSRRELIALLSKTIPS